MTTITTNYTLASLPQCGSMLISISISFFHCIRLNCHLTLLCLLGFPLELTDVGSALDKVFHSYSWRKHELSWGQVFCFFLPFSLSSSFSDSLLSWLMTSISSYKLHTCPVHILSDNTKLSRPCRRTKLQATYIHTHTHIYREKFAINLHAMLEENPQLPLQSTLWFCCCCFFCLFGIYPHWIIILSVLTYAVWCKTKNQLHLRLWPAEGEQSRRERERKWGARA